MACLFFSHLLFPTEGGKKSRCSFPGLFCCVYHKLSSLSHAGVHTSRGEEWYMGRSLHCVLQDFLLVFFVLFFPHFVARASASDHCIRRMLVQSGAQSKEDIVLVIFVLLRSHIIERLQSQHFTLCGYNHFSYFWNHSRMRSRKNLNKGILSWYLFNVSLVICLALVICRLITHYLCHLP